MAKAIIVKFPGRPDLPRTLRRGTPSDLPFTFVEELATAARMQPAALWAIRKYVQQKLSELQKGGA